MLTIIFLNLMSRVLVFSVVCFIFSVPAFSKFPGTESDSFSLEQIIQEGFQAGQQDNKAAQEIVQQFSRTSVKGKPEEHLGAEGTAFLDSGEKKRKKREGCPTCQHRGFFEKSNEKQGIPSQFLVFVSSSMPAASLKALFEQAESVGGKLIFRGLIENSFQKTKEFLEKHQINGEIDPLLFKDYQISYVPVFVLRKGEAYDCVRGNIPVLAALDQMKKRGDLKEEAGSLLEKRKIG